MDDALRKYTGTEEVVGHLVTRRWYQRVVSLHIYWCMCLCCYVGSQPSGSETEACSRKCGNGKSGNDLRSQLGARSGMCTTKGQIEDNSAWSLRSTQIQCGRDTATKSTIENRWGWGWENRGEGIVIRVKADEAFDKAEPGEKKDWCVLILGVCPINLGNIEILLRHFVNI